MSTHVGETKEQLSQKTLLTLKGEVQKDSWIALRQYFSGAGNGPEARVACVVLSTLAREKQSENNARQLTLLEKRFSIEAGRTPALTESTVA